MKTILKYKFILGTSALKEGLDSAVFINNIEVLEIETYVKILVICNVAWWQFLNRD